MAKRRRAKKSSSRTIRSNSTDSGSVLLGLAVLLVLIAIVSVAVGIVIVLIPLVLIPMWMICKKWSRGIKVLISILVIVIWLLLLPFALGFLREVVFEPEGERAAAYSESTPYPTITPIIINSPLPTSTPITLPTLTKGMSGEDVATLQDRLIDLRYLDGSADGQFGPKTEQAVKDFQRKNGLAINGVINADTCIVLFSDDALGFDPLQEIILSINENTTQADIEEMIGLYDLFYNATPFNSEWGQIVSYKIAYEEEAARHRHGITDHHIEVKFRKKTGQIVYASYFNDDAFSEDYHKNYEVRIYFEEGRGGLLGCYGFNASSDGYDTSSREVPFGSVQEALNDVLKNASQLKQINN